MIRAIILDFNGVIIDDEALHFATMRDAVADLGIRLTREEYWEKYLPLDDARCLDAVCDDYGVRLSNEDRAKALEQKVSLYYRMLQSGIPLFPGAAGFIKAAAGRYPLALASGARREEIETVLDFAGLRSCFAVIVAAEDFVQGKPHPESFLLALNLLNAAIGRDAPPIQPGECLVIEDSVGGIQGARAAGMLCLAVSNSYPREMLKPANRIVDSLEDIDVDGLQALFGGPA